MKPQRESATRILTLPPRREDKKVVHPTTSCSFSSLLHRSTPREEAADSTPTSSSFSSSPREQAADEARQQLQSLASRREPSHARGLGHAHDDKPSHPHSPECIDTVLRGRGPVERRVKRHKSLLRVSRSYEDALREPKTVCWASDEQVSVFSPTRLVLLGDVKRGLLHHAATSTPPPLPLLYSLSSPVAVVAVCLFVMFGCSVNVPLNTYVVLMFRRTPKLSRVTFYLCFACEFARLPKMLSLLISSIHRTDMRTVHRHVSLACEPARALQRGAGYEGCRLREGCTQNNSAGPKPGGGITKTDSSWWRS